MGTLNGSPALFGADDAPAAIMPNGHVLLAADAGPTLGEYSPPTQLFDFDPVADTISPVSPAIPDNYLNTNAYQTHMLVLPTGQVLFEGGSYQLWVYTPDGSASAAYLPAVTDVVYNGSGVFTLTGTQINGQSAGATYGDDAEMDENYPIVRLVNSSGTVYYCRTTNWSSVGVATGSAPETVNFTLNSGVSAGNYTLIVTGAGISSAGTPITITQAEVGDAVTNSNYSISGQITLSGSPLANVNVSLNTGATTVTNSSGYYSFSPLTASTSFTVTASLAGYEFLPQNQTVNTNSSGNQVANFIASAMTGELGFIPLTPCRVVDTRSTNGTFGGPTMPAGSTRSFPLAMGSCSLPSSASAYSLNVTVVPHTTLQYLSLWPTGQPQPLVSTLNSFDGRVVANAAIVPAGTAGAINVYVTDQSDVILDVNGYFGPTGTSGALTFVPVTPCRVEDTRSSNGTFGGPMLAAGSSRSFPIPSSSCSIPSTASAYSLNATVVPTSTLQYLTLYPTGAAQPLVSTLNSYNGQVVANAAIVPTGTGGAVSAYVTDQTQLITDINGYFTSSPTTPLVFNTLTPCRVVDTRNSNGTFGGPVMAASSTRSFPIPTSSCGIPATATAYAFNVTIVPTTSLNYLTLWPTGQAQPTVSTLNSYNGQVVANMALVPAGTSGAVSVFVTDQTQVIIDVVGYFSAP